MYINMNSNNAHLETKLTGVIFLYLFDFNVNMFKLKHNSVLLSTFSIFLKHTNLSVWCENFLRIYCGNLGSYSTNKHVPIIIRT